MRVPSPSSSKVTTVWTLNRFSPSNSTAAVNTSRSGGETSSKAPLTQWSSPVGRCMQTANTPPARKSISASGTEQPCGLNQRFTCSALLHALNTRSRGAAKLREITSGFGLMPELSGFVSDLMSCVCAIVVSCVFEFIEIVAQPVEPALPFGAAGVDPLLHEAQGARLD